MKKNASKEQVSKSRLIGVVAREMKKKFDDEARAQKGSEEASCSRAERADDERWANNLLKKLRGRVLQAAKRGEDHLDINFEVPALADQQRRILSKYCRADWAVGKLEGWAIKNGLRTNRRVEKDMDVPLKSGCRYVIEISWADDLIR